MSGVNPKTHTSPAARVKKVTIQGGLAFKLAKLEAFYFPLCFLFCKPQIPELWSMIFEYL